MKIMFLGLAALLLFAPESRAADRTGISGKWLGMGDWLYQGAGDRCYINMEFEEGPDYLIRKGGYFDCSAVGMNVEPARFIRQGALLLNEDFSVAGTYENNVITLKEPNSGNMSIEIVIRISGLHFDYSEIWRKADGSELYNITGRLFTGS